MRSQRVRHDWAIKTHTHTHTHTQYHWTKNMFSQSEYTHMTLLIQIYCYLSNDYYSILVTLGVRWWALLTWFSFSVICPCSLHPLKVLTHLKIFSFWCTLWTKLAGKKPILSWIFPWKEKEACSHNCSIHGNYSYQAIFLKEKEILTFHQSSLESSRRVIMSPGLKWRMNELGGG